MVLSNIELSSCVDPDGPAADWRAERRRVNRGGFWGSSDATAQVAFRSSDRPSHRSFFSAIGFRLARSVS